jgi:hypothetical protein
MEVTYYDCQDSGNLYARASEASGIFRLWANDRDGGNWQFLEPGSDAWAYASRKLYWPGDVEVVEFEAIDPRPPPLPPAPEGPFLTWAERRGKGQHYPVREFSRVADVVARCADGLTVYVVLSYDGYESAFGDGREKDFVRAFYSLAEAEDFLRTTKRDMYTVYEVTSLTLETDGTSLVAHDFEPTASEHYTIGQCLRALNEYDLSDGKASVAGQITN